MFYNFAGLLANSRAALLPILCFCGLSQWLIPVFGQLGLGLLFAGDITIINPEDKKGHPDTCQDSHRKDCNSVHLVEDTGVAEMPGR